MKEKPVRPPMPLELRRGFTESYDDPLRKELAQIIQRHGLNGAVLIVARSDTIGICSGGCDDHLALTMEKLGDEVLMAISDGQFDPAGTIK